MSEKHPQPRKASSGQLVVPASIMKHHERAALMFLRLGAAVNAMGACVKATEDMSEKHGTSAPPWVKVSNLQLGILAMMLA